MTKKITVICLLVLLSLLTGCQQASSDLKEKCAKYVEAAQSRYIKLNLDYPWGAKYGYLGTSYSQSQNSCITSYVVTDQEQLKYSIWYHYFDEFTGKELGGTDASSHEEFEKQFSFLK